MTLEKSAVIHQDLLSGVPVLNRQRQFRIDRKAVALFCTALLRSLGQQDQTLSVVFAGIREMYAINRRYRGKDYATDVLSFSYGKARMEGRLFLGEIVIAPKVAFDQANRSGVSPEKELRKLLVHGALHLLGYDHETDRGQMKRIQTKLLHRKFFLNPPPLAQLK
jgi:probable rRNA maturation factor